MSELKDLVLNIVKDFVDNDKLFTALDVSNLVKKTMPYVKHKETRDIIRELWITEIENHDYDRTPITVTLGNGNTAEALLYHPMSVSWDLDNLYDAQQRSQTSVVPNMTSVQTAAGTIAKDNNGVLTVTTNPLTTCHPAAGPAAADLWNQMWKTSPSLFPRKL